MAIALANSTFGNSLTPTLPATTAGNCLLVLVASGSTAAAVAGVTLGGAADNFAQLISPVTNAGGYQVFAWADPNCAGGQTALAITAGGSGLAVGVSLGVGGVAVYEISGLALTIGAILDKSSPGTGNSGTWSSGTTGTTVQAAEFWAGIAGSASSISGGPGAPWNNHAFASAAISGEQITTSTGTAVFSGTSTVAAWAAAVVTLQGVASGVGEPMNPRGWILSPFDQNTKMLGSEGISGP